MAAYRKLALSAAAQTSNNTHAGVEVSGPGQSENAQVGWELIVEAVGATPTVTWKVQGSLDGSNWYDCLYITDASDTASAATRTATAVGRQVAFLSNAGTRMYRYFRLVTSANTNVTYSGSLYVFTV